MENRIKLSVRMGLPLVLEMVTTIGLRDEVGGECMWLMSKARRDNMKPWQIELLNEAMQRIADRLAEVRITYSDDRQSVIDQVKEALKPVKTKYVYEKHLGMDTRLWTYRTRALHGKGYGYSFTEEDVLKINLAIADIVARLRRIELVAE